MHITRLSSITNTFAMVSSSGPRRAASIDWVTSAAPLRREERRREYHG
jgi:hypothetical protein